MNPSRFLIIGLGSMGKRRIKNLQNLKAGSIVGFDLKEERRKEAEEIYKINTIKNLKEVDFEKIDAVIISTPPSTHNQYLKLAIENKKPAFVEIGVILKGLEEINNLAKKRKVLVAPSCTFRFHPVIKDIKKIVKSGLYGRATNFSYHMGQYLPDWHPWESVKNFYAGQKETGGAREMVSFELTWLVDVLGFPKRARAFYGKTTDVGADINDTYAIAFDFGRSLGSLIIDVVSRYATRSLIINMEKGQIVWRWDESVMKLYEAEKQKWHFYRYSRGQSLKGYNKNITEEMYIEEMKTFIEAIRGKTRFPHSLTDYIKILKLLTNIEKREGTKKN